MRKPDEIMAEYLLKGGKMLAKTCTTCGSPLFEYKGTTLCVVCEEEKSDDQKNRADAVPQETRGKMQELERKDPISRENFRRTLDDEFALTIATFLRQAREDSDPARVKKALQAVKITAEAYAMLSH